MLRAALAAFLAISHGFAPSAPAPRFRTRARGLGARAPPPRAAPSDVDREKAGDRSALGLLRFLDLNDDGVLDRKDGQVAAVSLAIAAASLSNPTPALAKRMWRRQNPQNYTHDVVSAPGRGETTDQ